MQDYSLFCAVVDAFVNPVESVGWRCLELEVLVRRNAADFTIELDFGCGLDGGGEGSDLQLSEDAGGDRADEFGQVTESPNRNAAKRGRDLAGGLAGEEECLVNFGTIEKGSFYPAGEAAGFGG